MRTLRTRRRMGGIVMHAWAMETIARERLGDGIEVLRLDRPEVRNAMDTRMLAEAGAALAELAHDDTLRVLVLSTTDERALCAGADVGEVLDAAAAVARMGAFARPSAAFAGLPPGTPAVLGGNVVGAGAELAAAADLRVGGDNLRLAWPGGRLGVPIGPARLVPLVGLARAKELILTGRVVGAEEADALGLLARRTTAADAEAQALDLARAVAAGPPANLRRLKALFAEFEGLAGRTARENAEIVEFARSGPGVPPRGLRGT